MCVAGPFSASENGGRTLPLPARGRWCPAATGCALPDCGVPTTTAGYDLFLWRNPNVTSFVAAGNTGGLRRPDLIGWLVGGWVDGCGSWEHRGLAMLLDARAWIIGSEQT